MLPLSAVRLIGHHGINNISPTRFKPCEILHFVWIAQGGIKFDMKMKECIFGTIIAGSILQHGNIGKRHLVKPIELT